MKKPTFKATLFLTLIFALGAPEFARADFTNSDAFEPALLCGVGGGVGYLAAKKGNEILSAAVLCGAGAVVGLLVNGHYKTKYAKQYEEETSALKGTIQEMQMVQGMKAARGDQDAGFSYRIKQVIPGQRLPNGEVRAPTITEKLVLPGENLRVGE